MKRRLPMGPTVRLEEPAHEAGHRAHHHTKSRTINAVGHWTKAAEQRVTALEVMVQSVGRASSEPDAHAEGSTLEFWRHMPPLRHLQHRLLARAVETADGRH